MKIVKTKPRKKRKSKRILMKSNSFGSFDFDMDYSYWEQQEPFPTQEVNLKVQVCLFCELIRADWLTNGCKCLEF